MSKTVGAGGRRTRSGMEVIAPTAWLSARTFTRGQLDLRAGGWNRRDDPRDTLCPIPAHSKCRPLPVVNIAKSVTDSSLPCPRTVSFSGASPALLGGGAVQVGRTPQTPSGSPVLTVSDSAPPLQLSDINELNEARATEGWGERKVRNKEKRKTKKPRNPTSRHSCSLGLPE